MSDIKESKSYKELAEKGVGYVTSAVRAALEIVLFTGSLLQERAETMIPNQKYELNSSTFGTKLKVNSYDLIPLLRLLLRESGLIIITEDKKEQ